MADELSPLSSPENSIAGSDEALPKLTCVTTTPAGNFDAAMHDTDRPTLGSTSRLEGSLDRTGIRSYHGLPDDAFQLAPAGERWVR